MGFPTLVWGWGSPGIRTDILTVEKMADNSSLGGWHLYDSPTEFPKFCLSYLYCQEISKPYLIMSYLPPAIILFSPLRAL